MTAVREKSDHQLSKEHQESLLLEECLQDHTWVNAVSIEQLFRKLFFGV